jgi:hypothetical protein
MKNAFKTFVWKSEGKRQLRRPKHKGKIILISILRREFRRVWTTSVWLGTKTSGGFL